MTRYIEQHKRLLAVLALFYCAFSGMSCMPDVHVYEVPDVSGEAGGEAIAIEPTVTTDPRFFPLPTDGARWADSRRSVRGEFRGLNIEPLSVLCIKDQTEILLRIFNNGDSEFAIPFGSMQLDVAAELDGEEEKASRSPERTVPADWAQVVRRGEMPGRVTVYHRKQTFYQDAGGVPQPFVNAKFTVEPEDVRELLVGFEAAEFRNGALIITAVEKGGGQEITMRFDVEYMGSYKHARY
ncbi:MAG: hypothetical protein KF886_25840 [Candidatus Hydrogenedentes bacterium]|nr:hypothetical protein [Candidatus Hydrogenedentota bacterium]